MTKWRCIIIDPDENNGEPFEDTESFDTDDDNLPPPSDPHFPIVMDLPSLKLYRYKRRQGVYEIWVKEE